MALSSWLEPKVILQVMIGVCTIGGTALVTWNSGNIHSAMTDRDITDFKQALTEIKTNLSSIPVYAQKLSQLELWQSEQKVFNSSIDNRTAGIREDLRAITTDLANVKAVIANRKN